MRLRDRKILKMLFALEDGEWHTFPDDGSAERRMRHWVDKGYIHFHIEGNFAMMIATDEGLEYIAGLEGRRWSQQEEMGEAK